MKPVTDKAARAAAGRLQKEIDRLRAFHSYRDVATLVEWAARKLRRKRR